MRPILFAGLLALFGSIETGLAQKEYYRDIRPILESSCVVCHNHGQVDRAELSGGLALDSYEALMRGGKRPIIEPGEAARSEILARLTTSDPSRRMPKGGDPVDPDWIETIRLWISAGAKRGDEPVAAKVVAPTLALPTGGTQVSVRLFDLLIPFGGRPPLEAFAVEAPKAKTEGMMTDIPAALKIEEPVQQEKLIAQTYQEGLEVKVGPLPPVTALAFHPKGGLLLVGSYGHVVVWDLDRPAVIQELDGIAGSVNSVAFSPDGKLLSLVGGVPFSTGEIRLYDARDQLQLLATTKAHQEVILAQAFSPDSKRLATVSIDKTVAIWDVESRKLIARLQDHSDVVNCVAYAPDGKLMASAGMDQSAKISEGFTGKGVVSIAPKLEGFLAVVFSPDGRFLLTAGESPEIRWWQFAGQLTIDGVWIPARTMPGHSAPVHDLRFSPDGAWLASAGADHTVRLWDGKTGRLIRTLVDSDSLLYTAAFSPDSKRLAAGGADGVARVWDVNQGLLQFTLVQRPLRVGAASEWLAVSPDRRFNASPELAKRIRLREKKNVRR